VEVKRFLGFAFESNVYLIKADKIAIIDTGTGFYSDSLIKEIGTENIDYIILTHEHFDHCGGVKALKEISNAKVMAHKNASETLEKGLDWSASLFNAVQPKISIDRKLDDSDTIDLGNVILKVIYTPGHSKGSMCLYDEGSKSLFSGDTIFAYGGLGRTDFFGGNREELKKSVRKLASLQVNNLYPGHGEFILNNGQSHIEMALKNLYWL